MTDPPTRTLVLVRRAQSGDRVALERILERYYERVRRIVRVRLGPRLRGALDSGDILQETLLAATHKFDDFEPRDEASLINWLAKLAEHKITDAAGYHRAQKRRIDRKVSLERTSSESGERFAAEPPDRAPSPAEAAARAEETRIVEECLHELPEPYRELIIQRNYVGSSWADVAAALNRPSEAAARMMHAKAMVELSKLMRRRLSPGG